MALSGRRAAHIAAITAALVVLAAPPARPATPASDSLRISSQSNAGKGAWIGLGIGVLAGAGVWFLAAEHSGEIVPPLTTPLWYGGLGALTGALVGAGTSHERWSSLKIGDRVRLTAPTQPPSPVVGRLASADSSTLTIVVSEETRMAPAIERTIDRESLTRLELSEARTSQVGTGALIGGSVGVVLGVATGYAAAMADDDGRPLFTTPLIFGAMGVLAGAGIGAAVSSGHWRSLPPDTQVGFRPGTGSEPFALVIRTTF